MLRAVNVPTQDPKALEAYCLPFIRGEQKPATALELMASRYVAYTTGDIDYLVTTHDPETRSGIDRGATEEWSQRARWLGLNVVKTDAGGASDSAGEVEFIAHYAIEGVEQTHHEQARFRRIDGTWFFVDGELVAKKPIQRTSPKIGRNDPCSCGSGKKFKKCCG
jgi:SEC-C motif-containing protein